MRAYTGLASLISLCERARISIPVNEDMDRMHTALGGFYDAQTRQINEGQVAVKQSVHIPMDGAIY